MSEEDKIRYSHGPKFLDQLMEHTNGKAYRKKIEPCPYCEPKCEMFEKPKFATEWDEEGIVREIVFIRSVNLYYKKGRAMMVSACPRCRKLSFHHIEIERLLWMDWADKEIVQAEIDAWMQEAIDEWDRSMCKKCAVEKTVKKEGINKYGFHVTCDSRMGSPEDPDEEEWFKCTKFEEVA